MFASVGIDQEHPKLQGQMGEGGQVLTPHIPVLVDNNALVLAPRYVAGATLAEINKNDYVQ